MLSFVVAHEGSGIGLGHKETQYTWGVRATVQNISEGDDHIFRRQPCLVQKVVKFPEATVNIPDDERLHGFLWRFIETFPLPLGRGERTGGHREELGSSSEVDPFRVDFRVRLARS